MSRELEVLSQQVMALAAQRDRARKLLKAAEEEIRDLKVRNSEIEQELHQKNLDIEFLVLSHKLADNPQALAEARATIRRLIGRVDKTLELLKGDAAV